MIKLTLPFARLELYDNLDLSMNGYPLKYQSRYLRDMSNVLMSPEILDSNNGGRILYKMFRWAVEDKHRKLFERNSLRFDMTVIAPGLLGDELNKTLGHTHPEAMPGLSFPEIYQVIHGHAYFLLQRLEEGDVKDFKIIDAESGEAVLISPNYGHVTVNFGETPLLMSNLVSDKFSSDYSGYISKGGAAYYVLKEGRFLRNPKYGRVPEPRLTRERYAISKDLYTDFISCPGSFAFLNYPTINCPDTPHKLDVD